MLSVGGGASQPMGLLSERYSTGANLSISGHYRNKHNIFWGIGFEQLFGYRIKDSLLLGDLRNEHGMLIDANGLPAAVMITGTGFVLSAKAGYLITPASSKNKGIMFMQSFGFIEHRIKYGFQNAEVPGLNGEYIKGYDFLTNGLLSSSFLGYAFFGNEGKFNFSAGIEYSLGFTQNRRDWNFSKMEKEDISRLDQLLSLKFFLSFTFYSKDAESYHYY